MSMEEAKRGAEHISGVSNVAYDLLAVLYNKLEAVAALGEYTQDAQAAGDEEARAMFEQLAQSEAEEIGRLRALVAQRLS